MQKHQCEAVRIGTSSQSSDFIANRFVSIRVVLNRSFQVSIQYSVLIERGFFGEDSIVLKADYKHFSTFSVFFRRNARISCPADPVSGIR